MMPWLALAGLVIALDQGTKLIVVRSLMLGDQIPVLPFFSWVRWHNEGAAFSMLADAGSWKRAFFIALAVGFSAFILYELRRMPAKDRLMGCVYGLILGGALGNLYDRVFRGHVVDFVLFHWEQWYFPAFNVADSALFCGAVLWIALMVRDYRQERANVQADRHG